MIKFTFEVLRNDNKNPSESLEAYLLRVEEHGVTREYIIPEYKSELCDIERAVRRAIQEQLKTSM